MKFAEKSKKSVWASIWMHFSSFSLQESVINSKNQLKFPTNLSKTARNEPWFTFRWHFWAFLLLLELLLSVYRENRPKNLPEMAQGAILPSKNDPLALPINFVAPPAHTSHSPPSNRLKSPLLTAFLFALQTTEKFWEFFFIFFIFSFDFD